MAGAAEGQALIGKGGDKLLPEAAGIEAGSPQGEAISKRRSAIFQTDFLPSLRPFPGVKGLLARLKDEGLSLAVASSSKKDELEGLLRLCGAEEFIDASTSADDADNSKPDPDIVRVAMRRIGRSAEELILLGDTPYDLEAGKRAGVAVVALRCGGWGDADLVGAIQVYDNPAGLLARFDESPFARQR